MSLSLLLLCLLWSLVEVHSQTAPYLTFSDSVIPNHAYVDLSLVVQPGTDDSNSVYTVICHTDLDTCCGGADGHGEWFFPNGTALPGAGFNNGNQHSIAVRRLSTQRVRLQRGPVSTSISPIPSGIYQCGIETVAVSSEGGIGRETVYVGVYESGGTCNSCTYLYILFSYLECSIYRLLRMLGKDNVFTVNERTHTTTHMYNLLHSTHMLFTCTHMYIYIGSGVQSYAHLGKVKGEADCDRET